MVTKPDIYEMLMALYMIITAVPWFRKHNLLQCLSDCNVPVAAQVLYIEAPAVR